MEKLEILLSVTTLVSMVVLILNITVFRMISLTLDQLLESMKNISPDKLVCQWSPGVAKRTPQSNGEKKKPIVIDDFRALQIEKEQHHRRTPL